MKFSMTGHLKDDLFKYRWLLNRGGQIGRFVCIYELSFQINWPKQ